MTDDELDDMIGRLGTAIERAKGAQVGQTNYSTSSSLVADPT